MKNRSGCMSDKFLYFDGKRFTKDEKSGYYLNSTMRIRMHRYVWEYYNGKIPEGFEIHHIDRDKSNNEISNLEMLSKAEHKAEHVSNSRKLGLLNVESGHLDEIRILASKWHQSEKGRKWHKRHYEHTKEKLHTKEEFVCDNCGKTYIKEKTGNNRFCSNKCKAAWRRKSGVDDIERQCEVCGKIFTVNKYSKIRTCSRECGAVLRKKSKGI